MNRTRSRRNGDGRLGPARATVIVAVVAILVASSCDGAIDWKLGKTHGAIVEVGAKRGSLGIYRVPRKGLYEVYKESGTKAAQDVLWALGQPPVVNFSVGGLPITTEMLNKKLKGYIYGDPADFRGALLDAQSAHDCLALTLISQGLYIKNWTHKQVGCQMGSMP